MTTADHERIRSILTTVAAAVGGNVSWGASAYLDVWITEHRMRADEKASTRLTRATWALAGMTAALVLATIALVYVTISG